MKTYNIKIPITYEELDEITNGDVKNWHFEVDGVMIEVELLQEEEE